LKDLGVDGKEC